MCEKSALGVGLIEPENVIDYLTIKLHAGNKRSKGDLTRVTNMNEEISEEDGGLPNDVRRKKGSLKHWKSGWIEEIDKNLRIERLR